MGAKNLKRNLLSRRTEKQTQWVMGMTDKCMGVKRKSVSFGRTKSRHEYLEGMCKA